MKAQQATDPSMLFKINDIISFADFEGIRSYVWESGLRKTYCPNYKNNPYLELKDVDTEMYFNPSSTSGFDSLESDYNIMYIVAKSKDLSFNYYIYLNDNGAVYLYDYDRYLSDEHLKVSVLNQLKEILNSVRSTIVSS